MSRVWILDLMEPSNVKWHPKKKEEQKETKLLQFGFIWSFFFLVFIIKAHFQGKRKASGFTIKTFDFLFSEVIWHSIWSFFFSISYFFTHVIPGWSFDSIWQSGPESRWNMWRGIRVNLCQGLLALWLVERDFSWYTKTTSGSPCSAQGSVSFLIAWLFSVPQVKAYNRVVHVVRPPLGHWSLSEMRFRHFGKWFQVNGLLGLRLLVLEKYVTAGSTVIAFHLSLVVTQSSDSIWQSGGRDSSAGREMDLWSEGRQFNSWQERKEYFLLQLHFLCWLLFGGT